MLSEKVEKILETVKNVDLDNTNENIRKAELLADKYSHVQPKTYSVPMERFAGLPEFHNEKNACY